MRYETNACHSLVSSVDTAVDFYYDLRVSQQEERLFFSLFFVSKMYGTPSLHSIKYVADKMHIVCNKSIAVCGLTRAYLLRSILLAREYKPCRFVRTCIIPPSRSRGRSHSQCCCVNFSGAVIVTTTTSSFESCVRLPRLDPRMYVRVPTEIQ